jgi:hypothetical protein
MNKPDLQALHAVGIEMLELKDAGRWTIEEWERLVVKAKIASRGDLSLVEPILRQKPGGLKLTVRNGIGYLE